MQRPAKPLPSVRFRPWPPNNLGTHQSFQLQIPSQQLTNLGPTQIRFCKKFLGIFIFWRRSAYRNTRGAKK